MTSHPTHNAMIRILTLALLFILAPSAFAQFDQLQFLPGAQAGPSCDTAILRVKNVSTQPVYITSLDYDRVLFPGPISNDVVTWTAAVSDQIPTLDDDFWVQFIAAPTTSGLGYFGQAFFIATLPPGHEVLIAISDSNLYYQPDSTPNTYNDGVLEASTVQLGVSPATHNGYDMPPFGTSSVLGNPRMAISYTIGTNPYEGIIESLVFASGRAGIHHPNAGLGLASRPIVQNATIGESLDVFINTGPGSMVGWVAVSLVQNDPDLPLLGTFLRINDLDLYFPLTPYSSFPINGLELSYPLPTTLSGLIGLPLYMQDFLIPFSTFELTSTGGFVTVID